MGLPRIRARDLPGKRVDPYRDGITATMDGFCLLIASGVGLQPYRASSFRKYSIVTLKPSSTSTFGCQPSFCFASVMSGWRWVGSSDGNGFRTIFEREPVMAMIF